MSKLYYVLVPIVGYAKILVDEDSEEGAVYEAVYGGSLSSEDIADIDRVMDIDNLPSWIQVRKAEVDEVEEHGEE